MAHILANSCQTCNCEKLEFNYSSNNINNKIQQQSKYLKMLPFDASYLFLPLCGCLKISLKKLYQKAASNMVVKLTHEILFVQELVFPKIGFLVRSRTLRSFEAKWILSLKHLDIFPRNIFFLQRPHFSSFQCKCLCWWWFSQALYSGQDTIL